MRCSPPRQKRERGKGEGKRKGKDNFLSTPSPPPPPFRPSLCHTQEWERGREKIKKEQAKGVLTTITGLPLESGDLIAASAAAFASSVDV